jgi:1-deoxy-D-xylulose-5-phosphate reductoisomerase
MVDLAIAGSTGSIGTQALEVVAAEPDRFTVTALGAGGGNVDLVIDQARAVRARVVAIADATAAQRARDALPGVEVRAGEDALSSLAGEADVVLNGVVGFAGLPVTLATLEAGKRLALANKESLIAAGPVVQRARRTPGAELLPVDSEHGALQQCLRGNDQAGAVRRLVLTASGGPFRGKTLRELAGVTVEDALAHPTWSMGPKITVDSSTLMNKGLEVIEAYELFGTPAGDAGVGITLDQIDVVVHPQSIVHSMVEFVDGATLAQLSMPDMRLPIGYALAFPDRIGTPFGGIDWGTVGRLDFEPPDTAAFRCLPLAYEAARVGGTAPAWLNAANEVAVAAFLAGEISWTAIPEVIETVLALHDGTACADGNVVVAADEEARQRARMVIEQKASAA